MSTLPTRPIKLYRHPLSGHSHRVELFLSVTGLPFEKIEVDLMKGAHKQPDFLKMNAFGQVPVIDDSGTIVSDSNAIMVYLATKYGLTTWLPQEPVALSQVQRWLSVAAGQIAFGPAAARLITVFGAKFSPDEVIGRAHGVLKVIDAELAGRSWLVGSSPTVADVAGYSYIAHAPEGNVSLGDYPNVRSWLARIEALKGFVPMQKTAAGLAA